MSVCFYRNAWAQIKRRQTCQWQQGRYREGDSEASLQGSSNSRGGGKFNDVFLLRLDITGQYDRSFLSW